MAYFAPYKTFLDIFQSRKQQPCVYMRCLLQSLIFSKTQLPSPEGAKTVLFEDLRELVLPSDQALDEANDEVEAPMDDRFQIARRMETFVNHMRNVCKSVCDLSSARLTILLALL